jgi:antitoxin VapB
MPRTRFRSIYARNARLRFGERADLLERADANAEDAKRGIRIRAQNTNNVYTLRIYIRDGGWRMGTARIFRSGNSQAVRLPKQFRLKSKEVEIFRRGDEIVLREKDGTMVRAFDLLASLPADLEFVGREKDQPQKRKGL